MVNRFYKIRKNIIEKRHSLYSLGAGSVFFAVLYFLTKLFGCSLCPINNLFGIRCLGCGLTRGFICILEMDFIEATKYNLLSIPIFIGIAVYVLVLLTDVLFGKNNIKIIEKIISKWYMFVLYFVIIVISRVPRT